MSKQALQHKLTLNIVVELEGLTKDVHWTRQRLELAAITAIENARENLSSKKTSRVSAYAMQSSTDHKPNSLDEDISAGAEGL